MPEINLTPLLDVLFSILFIVMLAGKGMQGDYQEQVNQLENENQELKEQIACLDEMIESYEKYQSEVIIITINNTAKDGEHYLNIYQGREKEPVENIQMGLNKLENTKKRITGIMEKYLQPEDSVPIYVVFYCDKKVIYKDEYSAVRNLFEEMQYTNKEVFFKTMEAEN